uniref:hypothetical protein n=1 Tax=Providencia manganoxydans TaxID=2923283 RepID=UPI0029BFEF8C|nr:hypothetical protein [Providencia manganoxydans]
MTNSLSSITVTSTNGNGWVLSKVYDALGMKVKDKPQKPDFASLMKQFTNVDPYQCMLCGS